MGYEQILYTVKAGVATVTLNRPEKLNAWTAVMEREVHAAVRAAAGDEAVRVIVLTGAGRGFCAGADMSLLQDLATGAPAESLDASGYHWPMAVSKPVIAAINGPAVGLGFVIPLYCDIRIAAESARFSVVFSRRGLIAEWGIAWILPRLVGLPHALDLTLTSRTIDAAHAHRIGLVTEVFPTEGFGEHVQEWAARLAAEVSPRSLRIMKKQIWDAQKQDFTEAFEAALAAMNASLASDDFREGVAHWIEKRPPRFSGR
jgi:enoyl-CoA hydratase/carnithine racemase